MLTAKQEIPIPIKDIKSEIIFNIIKNLYKPVTVPPDKILFFALSSFIIWCNVSQFSTHPIIPALCDNGITEYVIINRFLSVYNGIKDNNSDLEYSKLLIIKKI